MNNILKIIKPKNYKLFDRNARWVGFTKKELKEHLSKFSDGKVTKLDISPPLRCKCKSGGRGC